MLCYVLRDVMLFFTMASCCYGRSVTLLGHDLLFYFTFTELVNYRSCDTFLTHLSQDVVPVLKYCRGEMLSQDHWLELFRLIGIPRGTMLEKLTLGDLLTVSEAIITHTDALKVLPQS